MECLQGARYSFNIGNMVWNKYLPGTRRGTENEKIEFQVVGFGKIELQGKVGVEEAFKWWGVCVCVQAMKDLQKEYASLSLVQ